jgi:hypothetical protein
MAKSAVIIIVQALLVFFVSGADELWLDPSKLPGSTSRV